MENLTCTRKLFLYNLLCMTHHITFANSVWENYKSGVDFAPGRHFGESQPKKLKSLFSRNKQRSKCSYREHSQKHKPQEMINQYACNKPSSRPLNVRLSTAKTRFTQSKFRMLHVLHCVVLVNFAREKKRKRTTVQADSQGHVSHYYELMSCVWPINAHCLLFWWMEYGIIMMGCRRGIPEGRDWKDAQGSRPLQVASSSLTVCTFSKRFCIKVACILRSVVSVE